jgi:hypothetical protein
MYHLTEVRLAIIKRLEITNAGKYAEKRELLHIAGGSVN